MGRAFTSKQKRAVALATGINPEGMHADHIKPFSAGGETDVTNCQLLSPEQNRKKGSNFMELREWQDKAFRKWESRTSNVFTLVATPGSGKTHLALHVAGEFLREYKDNTLVIVVPTDQLRTQWQKEAARNGIQITDEFNDVVVKAGYKGLVTTYATVAGNSEVFRAYCRSHRLMVIMDEVHHCGDVTTWGDALFRAFDKSSEKFLMSGTPFRTDGTRIPFIRYDESGVCVADHRYTQTQALVDGIVRHVHFEFHSGHADVQFNDATIRMSVNSESTDSESALRFLLDADGMYVRSTLLAAHNALLRVRELVPDAAGIVACIDVRHATRVAQLLKAITGEDPSIIVSDSSVNNDCVEDFRNGSKKWIVTVRMVSEGTDIKRLQVLCYFTNATTDMFFRQLVGRVSRMRGLDDYESLVFLPADSRLIECSKDMEREQSAADIELDEQNDREYERLASSENVVTFQSSESNGIEMVVIYQDGKPVSVEKATYDAVSDIANKSGIKVADAFKVFKAFPGIRTGSQPGNETEHVNMRDEESRLRRECNQKAAHLARVLLGANKNQSDRSKKIMEIHARYRPAQAMMTVSQLKEKKASLAKEIHNANQRGS